MVIQLTALDTINLNLTEDSNYFDMDGPHDHQALLRNIDLMREQMNADDELFKKQEVKIEFIVGATVSLTAGLVNWVLRGGALLSSLLSSASLFKQFDPLAVVFSKKKRNNKTDDIELTDEQKNVESMFDK